MTFLEFIVATILFILGATFFAALLGWAVLAWTGSKNRERLRNRTELTTKEETWWI